MKKLVLAGVVLGATTASLFGTPALADHEGGSHGSHGSHHGNHAMHVNSGRAPSTEKGSDHLRVEDCWIRLLPKVAPSGGFFVLHNQGKSEPVVLKGIQTDAFGMSMLHETTEKNGMSAMTMVPDVTIEPGQSLSFKPGSYHAMLEKPRADLKAGQQITVNFELGTGKKIPVQCTLKSPSARSFSDQ
ncbi:copper chaperone PCu(A)C [Advenella sp. FME57]|uniref:copper chaperone PCu(A)C n=1 Tax=Advenella sp. FME57 TaxID=2742604 RepID=UPI0018691F03|nr:copper chaperone PCu(A)C [Advenella sp. FME57]